MAPADLVDLLGCAALEPDLGGILFVDLDPRLLLPYAEVLARAISTVEGDAQPPVIVGTDTTDEQLWPDWGVTVTAECTFALGARPGLLRHAPGPLLIVPDLARAGTPVTRAIVATLGVDVVHVERPGVSERWPARARWLTACAGRDIAVLSAHLLDRFPVRVDGAAAPRALNPDRVAVNELLGQARRSQRCRPPLSPDLLDFLLHLDTGRPSIRRSLALARVARAVAERRGAKAVEHADVRRAADLIGIAPTNEQAPLPVASSLHTPPVDRPTVEDLATLEPTGLAAAETETDIDDLVLAESNAAAAEVEPPVALARLDTLHPEDSPDALPEPRSLRWAVTGKTAARRPDGMIVGHERSADLRDLAVVPTLLEALRRTWSAAKHSGMQMGRPVVQFHDLRKHRRKHGPHHALVLVVDHSVRRNWDGSPGLAPHLRWAYDQGATVSVVEFGHADSRDELRPERYRSRSIADPQIFASLHRSPGAASPLAAAIELAAEELRRHMHRGWASVRAARLVLVTDGRGNVTLEATAERRVVTHIARQGIDDALTAARAIAGMHRVTTTVVAPIDEQYPTLTADLAFALGGTVTYVDKAPGVTG